jgi:N-acetyl sugar amidotransferase
MTPRGVATSLRRARDEPDDPAVCCAAPPMPRYCTHCILPDTRPGVVLDAAGVCRGCRNAVAKRSIDWAARRAQFVALADDARRRSRGWDCLIPVSGGKDSYWQVVTCLEHGLRPLCVTCVYPGRNRHGEENLRRLLQLGVDHFEFRLDPRTERVFQQKAFRRFAISGLVAHLAIYHVPLRLAVAFRIPLVVYGENSAFEYGTHDDTLAGPRLDRRWLQSFGVSGGTTAEDWVDADLPRAALTSLLPPDEDELAASGVVVTFLGHWFAWDPEHSRRIATAHGFRASADGPRVGHYDYVNIDDDLIAVHHHPKWHKFGITRSWDNVSVEIRHGRMTRDQAIAILRARGDETPWADIERYCSYLGITETDYFATLDGFRNRELWTRRGSRWVIDGFLVPDFPWPEDPACRS